MTKYIINNSNEIKAAEIISVDNKTCIYKTIEGRNPDFGYTHPKYIYHSLKQACYARERGTKKSFFN